MTVLATAKRPWTKPAMTKLGKLADVANTANGNVQTGNGNATHT